MLTEELPDFLLSFLYSALMIIGALTILLQIYVYFHGCRKYLETHEENEWDQVTPIKMTA